MSRSRNTVDTDVLRIRDVFCFNPSNMDFIQPLQIPSVGRNGQLKWYSSLEFLSSIYISSVSSSVLDILESVQEGISTMSTINNSTFTEFLTSTSVGSIPIEDLKM